MTAFAFAVGALFEDDNLAKDAIWRAGGAGAGISVRVIVQSPERIADLGGGRFVATGRLLDCRTDEIADLETGDTFEINGETLIVQGEPLHDAEALIWKAEVRPQ